MTDILCQVCDYEKFNDKNELNYYLASCRKRYDSGLYYKYTIKNINLNNINKIFDYYITIHNEKFDVYFIICVIQIRFNNNFIVNLEISNHYNTDYVNIQNYLSGYLKCCERAGYKINNINHMIINITSCICKIRYKHYIDKPMSMLERRINYIITKNPLLINKNHNHPLIRKYPNIKYNNI